MTLQDKMLVLAELTTECPGDSVVPPPSYGIIHALAHCTQCDNTGRVSLLDPPTPEHPAGKFGLRVKCSQCFGDGKQRQLKVGGMALAGAWDETESVDAPCPTCQGRGWTLTTDPWTCVRAAWSHLEELPKIMHLGSVPMQRQVLGTIHRALDFGTDPVVAAFDVVWEALKGVANG